MNPLHILFPGYINTITFEHLLRHIYTTSREENTSEVLFDLKKVGWIETFQLSLLALWISELLSKGRKVTFMLPSPEPLSTENQLSLKEKEEEVNKRLDVYSYLFECLFLDFLQKKNILGENDLKGYQARRREKSIESRISPFIFFSIATDFHNFMQQIHDQYSLQFGPIMDMAVVKSGEIRDIILKELGDNIFDHAKGKFAHLLMTLRKPIEGSDQYRRKLRETRINTAPIFERLFFENLGDSGYLIVVVSDKGPGIRRTLLSEYRQDTILTTKKLRPSEYEIIDYAFLRHSSSKGRDKRLGHIQSLIQKYELADTIPATGLFYVKEVVKTYRGLLLVRSGHSLVCYDFLTYPEDGHPKNSLLTNKEDRKTGSLENFGGTQIRIYFPTYFQSLKRKFHFYKTELPNQSFKRRYEYFVLDAPPSQPNDLDSAKLWDWLSGHIDYVHKINLSIKESKTLVVDCNNLDAGEGRTIKALYLLVVELMRSQNRNFSVVIINGKGVLERIGSYLTQLATTESGILKEKPILAFDEDFNLAIHGLPEQEISQFREILRQLHNGKPSPGLSLSDNLLNKIEHLIGFDPETNTYHTLFLIMEVKKKAREAIEKKLGSIILDPLNNIYLREGCFLIPSGAFSEGYFELHRLFKEDSWRRDVILWLRYAIEHLQPNRIVSLGRGASSLGEEIVKSLKDLKHTNIQDPRNPSQSIQLALLPKNDKTVILTDVIGTQRSLNTVLGFSKNLDVRGIFTLVDSREENGSDIIKYDGKDYHLESILKQPIRFWPKDKPHRYTYEEIKRVDPISNAVITDPVLFEETIWTRMDERTGENEFFQILRETNGIVIGHFKSNERHILYLFRTSAIVDSYGNTIVDKIHKDIDRYRGGDPNLEVPITHVFYPEHTPAAGDIAKQISLDLGGARFYGLAPRDLKNPLSFPELKEKIGNAVIFDDASGTGNTALRMIQIVERNAARTIFLYLLCNRANRPKSQSLRLIQAYGHSTIHVRYLCELPIPTFSADDCPVCKVIERLKKVREELKDIKQITRIIDEDIYSIQEQPISVVLAHDTATPYISTPLDERVIQADLRARLEVAKDVLPVRRELAELVRKHREAAEKVLLFFKVISREEFYFLADPITFKDVFYDSFRSSIINACEFFIEEPSINLSEEQVITIISILRIFDADKLIDNLETILKRWPRNEALFIKILLQFFLSEEARKRAPYIGTILRKYLTGLESPSISDIVKAWEKTSVTGPPSIQVFETFKKASEALSDSAQCAHYFADLEYYNFPNLNLMQIEDRVRLCWKPIASLLKTEIVPRLREFANTEICKPFCEDLEQEILLVNSLLYKGDELSGIILDEERNDEVRKTACNGFHAACVELHRVLLEDVERTIPRSLRLFRTELGRVIRRVIGQRAGELEINGISVELSIPEDPQLVFGHEIEIFSVADILLENVTKRAFEGVSSAHKKICSIEVVEDWDTKDISLIIMDNGKGISPEPEFGVGLSTVDNLSRRMCSSWEIGKASKEPFSTRVRVSFYALPKRGSW